jgi:UDP-N-acetylglucosamine diphosphorylase / glucose-1-phosphate thymidylyltransferase / UDP-N-acetylgalactosamine diphosphorylase / glucosamine-1-phosphate N-acetyltransferase / galactosamine-1-phosphate N-acetyltransferase
MVVVVPMAGRGSRMGQYSRPKPLIEIEGRLMVSWALESLTNVIFSQLVFVALEEHERDYGVCRLLRSMFPGSEVVLIPEVTEGQLCTVLKARNHFLQDEDLLVCPSDTFMVSNIGREIRVRSRDCRGIISVKDMPGDCWSFARTDGDGTVVEVAEKKRISDHASTGFYYFSSSLEFLKIADGIVKEQERACGEFYVIPVYQHLIGLGKRVILSQASQVYDMGSEEAKSTFEQHLRKEP